jgi:transcriptional regulator of acetoin/glycerol metabolism
MPSRTFSLFDVNAVAEGSARRAAELARPRRPVGKAVVPVAEAVLIRDTLIRTLVEAGMPVCQIAAAVGRDEKTVYRRMARMGLEPPRRRTGS